LPAKKRAKPSGTRRPSTTAGAGSGAAPPPAKPEPGPRRTEAVRSGPRRAGTTQPPAKRRRQEAAAPPPPRRVTRDKVLGLGALVCAILALGGLNFSTIALLFGLGYAALAFLRASDLREARLVLAGCGFTLWLLVRTVVLYALLAASLGGETTDEQSALELWSPGGAFIALGIVSGVAITLAAALAALAFSREGSVRYRMLSWSGLCIAAYYVLFLPGAIAGSLAAPALGSFWAEPLIYTIILIGIFAGLAISRAFAWTAAAKRGAGAPAAAERRAGAKRGAHAQSATASVPRAEREYLLLVAAVSLLLLSLLSLVFKNWTFLQRTAGQTVAEWTAEGVASMTVVLLLPALFLSASAGFLVSCRQAGWRRSRWTAGAEAPQAVTDGAAAARTATKSASSSAGAAGPGGAASATAGNGAAALAGAASTDQAPAPSRARRLLLTWRLPLLYGWFLALTAACSFVHYYGFAVLVPAAAHYLWMRMRERGRGRERGGPSAPGLLQS
jgi:hypothetical protein